MSSSDAESLVERLDGQSTKASTPIGNGGDMIWRRWGNGPPIVLLHGGAGSWMHWIRNIEPLAETRTVWVPDMPGFGDSDYPGDDHDADGLAPLVLAGLQEVVGPKCTLVGFSFGGLVSAIMAAAAPDRFDLLVLVSIAGLGVMPDAAPKMKSMRKARDEAEIIDALRTNLGAIMIHDPGKIDDLAIAVQRHSAPRERSRNRTLVTTEIIPSLAPRWSCPAYGIWGAKDFLYKDKNKELKEKVATLGLREVHIFEDTGHWLQFEDSERFNTLLSEIIDGRDGE